MDGFKVISGLFFLILSLLHGCCVKINQFLVPEIASPKAVPIILDCDYSLEFPKDEGLVVKWFFNETTYPVYQWIPDAKPQELRILKGRLDLSYRASEDRLKVHRALKIVKLGPELSGNYTCLVSTYSSEDRQTKRMSVFVPQKSLELKYPTHWNRNEEEKSKILCYAEEIYPKPQMKLFLNNSEIENSTMKFQEKPSGLFDVELFTIVDNLTDGTAILCELNVRLANYTVRKEAVYYKDFNGSFSSGTRWNCTIKYILLLLGFTLFF